MISIAEVVFKDIPENQDYIGLTEQVLQKCFETEALNPRRFYICVTLTNPENIHRLNKQYRNVDKPTDVLSFPMFEKGELSLKIELMKKQITKNKKENKAESKNKETEEGMIEEGCLQDVLGDIVISTQRVKEQALEYGHSFEREYAYMLVHGFYHLMGYDHMEEDEKKIMREKEENVLLKLELVR